MIQIIDMLSQPYVQRFGRACGWVVFKDIAVSCLIYREGIKKSTSVRNPGVIAQVARTQPRNAQTINQPSQKVSTTVGVGWCT